MGKIKDFQEKVKITKEVVKNIIAKTPKDPKIAYGMTILDIEVSMQKIKNALKKRLDVQDRDLLKATLNAYDDLLKAIVKAKKSKRKSFDVLKKLKKLAELSKYDERIKELCD